MKHILTILLTLFSIITSGQWVDTTWRYQDTTRFISEKHPKYGPWNKPTSLNEPGLVAAYNMTPSAGGVLTDISGTGNNGTIIGAISSVDGMVFDGIDDNVVLGNVGNVKSIAFRIKPESTTEKILEGAANDKLIHINSGTLTYPDYDDAYVDGINTNTIVADQWQNVTVVSSTDVDNTALMFALNNATYGDFEIEDLKFYSTEFTEQQAQDYHNSFAKRVVLIDNFEYDAVGAAIPQGWTPSTGTYEIKELAVQDDILKHLDVGTKYLECTGAGTIAIPSKAAYGTWEFDIYKGSDATVPVVFYTTDSKGSSGTNRHGVRLMNTEAIQLLISSTIILSSAASYIDFATWYSYKITCTKDGETYFYVKGGAFGSADWTLVSVSGGSGTNPVVSASRPTPELIALDFDTGDRIANIKITEGVEQ